MSLRNVLALTAVLSLTAVAANAGALISGGSAYGTDSNVTFTYPGPPLGPYSGTAKTVKGGNQNSGTSNYSWANAKSTIGADWVSAFNDATDVTIAKSVSNLTGDFTYTVTFTSNATGGIFGKMYSDDYLTKVILNGTNYSGASLASIYTGPANTPWQNQASLNIGTGVISGLNTLSFTINNSGANTAGIAFNLNTPAVPEPGEYAAMAMAGLSVCGLMLRARCKQG